MNIEGSIYPRLRRRYARCRSAATSCIQVRSMTGAVVMSFLALTDTLAHARLQRQIDAETGITTYSFQPSPSHRMEKRALPPPPPTATPTPTTRAAPDTTPLRTTPSAAKQTETRTAPAISRIPSSYRDFPRVSPETQKERDAERRRILKQELAGEEEQLAQAIENKAAGDMVQRFRANIEALHREIRNAQ